MTRITGKRAVASVIAAFSMLATQSVLHAQETADAGATTTTRAAPVCLRGAWRDVPQVAQAKRGAAIDIVVASRDAPGLTGKGFAQVDCSTTFATPEARAAWRDQACGMAAFGNEAVQNQFERAWGARPAVLCGSAEQVAWPWQGVRSETTTDRE